MGTYRIMDKLSIADNSLQYTHFLKVIKIAFNINNSDWRNMHTLETINHSPYYNYLIGKRNLLRYYGISI